MLIASDNAPLAMTPKSPPQSHSWQTPEGIGSDESITPEAAQAEMDRFFNELETELKGVPKGVMEVGAQRVLDFLKGELSWAEIFNIQPETMQRLAEFGYLKYKAGRYEEAERFFKVLTMLNWNNGDFHAMLGAIYLQQKRYAESIVSYTQAIELNPHDGLSLTNRADLYLRHGWLNESAADLQMALQIAGHEKEEWGSKAKGMLQRIHQVEAQRSGKVSNTSKGKTAKAPKG